ncbi:hypothetical protein D0Y65_042397, partial [Glycine soja]
ILPLPNVPSFCVLFSTYSHWRVLHVRSIANAVTNKDFLLFMSLSTFLIGSEKLFQLVSDSSKTSSQSHELCWVLRPSKELENLVPLEDDQDGLSQHAIVDICKIYDLNTKDVIKYEKYIF